MFSGLHYFEKSLANNGRGKSKKAFSWGLVDMATVASYLVSLCQQVKVTLTHASCSAADNYYTKCSFTTI